MNDPMNDPMQQTSNFGKGYSRNSGCLKGVGLGCLISLVLPFVMLGGCSMLLMHGVNTAAISKLESPIVYGEEGHIDVRQITINGVIGEESSWGVTGSSVSALEQIRDLTDDEEVKALILRVDSPGGGVTASDELYHALEVFKSKDAARKVFVLAGDLLASGAYYLAMQADYLQVQPTTMIGSIGVIMSGVNVSELAKKIGVADASIASGASKDFLNPLKPENPEQVAMMRGVIGHLHNRFVGLVAKGRHLSEEEVAKLADGRVFHAQDALNLKLVDAVGYEEDLYAEIEEVLGGDITVTAEESPEEMWAHFFSSLSQGTRRVVREALFEVPTGRAEYRFR